MGGYRDATGQAMLGLYALFADCASGLLPLLAGRIRRRTRHLPLGRPCRSTKTRWQRQHRQVSAPGASRFQPHPQDVLNAGYSTSVFWLKVDLHYAAASARRGNGCWSWPTRRWITSTLPA
jgi:hypothetical protein